MGKITEFLCRVVYVAQLVYSVLMNETDLALYRLRTALIADSVSVAHFRRTDGRIVTLEGVNVDSIGPSAANPGVIAVEYTDDLDRITHLPFIESWEIEYR